MQHSFKCIARIYNDYSVRFGIPRQSGIIEDIESKIIFEPEYRCNDAIRGLEEFSCLCLIWLFTETVRDSYKPTVRPPKLGGNRRVGVFATRSPFRPNPIGLSCVTLSRIDMDCADAPVIYVKGADLMNGTPLFDIKPYIPYTDCRPEALSGFSKPPSEPALKVECSDVLSEKIPPSLKTPLFKILSLDPRPGYHNDDKRIYSFEYGGLRISFTVSEGVLKVNEVNIISEGKL